ncbi:L-type lectin-domain containing receptor kinase IX.1-like [Ipomoea triloba]|uniref:L-type lectin-domain containing receptor kinase IX.1-like n=1 Tax=Ipomoea triloba TaxID=35885 RepID=UPI00125D5AF4|nr:L-type lectin-domain containing receptor kinase IX.1-like [Ipomoea triloba]
MAAALCRFFLVLIIPSLVFSLSFNLSQIDQNDANVNIQVEGNASITDQGIKLTNECVSELNDDQVGGARYVHDLFHLWDNTSKEFADFATNFTFNLDYDENGYPRYNDYGYTLIFFLAENSTPFQTMLFSNETHPTSPDPFIAVVFDTFSDHNNVSINIISRLEPVIFKRRLSDTTEEMTNDVSITYNASSAILQVVFTGFGDDPFNNLSGNVNLSNYLPEFVSIGFAATTQGCYDNNNIKSWQFDSTSLRPNVSSPAPSPAQNQPVPAPTSPTPNHIPSIAPSPDHNYKLKKRLEIAGLSSGVVILLALLALAIYTCFKKKWAAKRKNHEIILGPVMVGEFEMASYGPKNFSYCELASATNNFSEERKLGEGGFGGVYSGFLRDLNMDVAVKRVSSHSKQGIEEYTSEVKIISQLRHRNLVPLHGWCHENGELLLVYEYMPGGSLDSHLFKRRSPLHWGLRYKIAQGLASALSYLHEEWEQCVLHRDIKSSNVLLDSSFNARLGDFGLAWPVDHEETPEKTYLGGTPGYVAPECHITFKTSKESDVYSFGVVALEIACGRKAILANKREGRKSLVDWVWDLYGMGRLLEAADPKLNGNFEKQEMERLMTIGLWCAHPDSNSRPKISLALHCLKFQVQLPILPAKMPKPVYSTLPTALSFPNSHFSGIKNVEIQEFEYPSSYSRHSAGSSLPHTV